MAALQTSTVLRPLIADPRFPARALAGLACFIILGAWGFQLIGGLAPCPLCLTQRLPWYALTLLAGALMFEPELKLGRNLMIAGFSLAALLALWSAYEGLFHAGVEYKWWKGPATCTTGGLTDGINLDDLSNTKIPMCDQAPWDLFGISLAGFNFLFSIVALGLAGLGLARAMGRVKP